MPYNIGTEQDPILIYARMNNGMLDCSIRCDTREAFLAAAVYAELMYQDAEGEYQKAQGVHIDEIGPMMLTQGEYDAEGNETLAPTFDPRHHVNFRLSGPALETVDEFGVVKWQKWAAAWSTGGVTDPEKNAAEEALKLHGVALIDPDTISSPSRIWA